MWFIAFVLNELINGECKCKYIKSTLELLSVCLQYFIHNVFTIKKINRESGQCEWVCFALLRSFALPVISLWPELVPLPPCSKFIRFGVRNFVKRVFFFCICAIIELIESQTQFVFCSFNSCSVFSLWLHWNWIVTCFCSCSRHCSGC